VRRLLPLGLAAIAFAARVLTGPHPIDDAYITFRYARNLAEGAGLVYNPGEWVLGTTAPLWAIVLGLGYRLGLTDLPWLAAVLSALCDAASAALLFRMSRRMGLPPFAAALVGLAWALNPMSIGFASGGMETSLFVLLALTALSLSAASTRAWLAASVCGIATLVRPEGALLATVVVGWTWFSNRKQMPGAIIAAAVPMGLMGATLLLRYGSPLPNSVAAKQLAYQPAWPLENALALLVQAGLPGWSTYLLASVPGALGLLACAVGLVTLIVLARRGLFCMQRNDVTWQPFAGFAALYIIFYVVVGVRGVRLFPWYLVPIEPFYLLGAAAGLTSLRARHAAWLAAALVLWQAPAIDWRQPLLPLGEDLAREQLYVAVGKQLAASMQPGAVVAAPEIGALGYSSNLRVLDTVGLVSPSALPYYPLPADQLVTDNAIPARLISDHQPDAVVTLDAFAARSLLTDPIFEQDYQLAARYPANVWQSHELLVFRRVDAP
jgi:arabinofuranosyltransferase